MMNGAMDDSRRNYIRFSREQTVITVTNGRE